MIDTNELRDRAATFGTGYLTYEECVEVINRLEAAEKEREELRAKIEAAERQVPICRAEDLKHAESLLPMLGLKPESRLYALPCAQPAPSVPIDSIGKLLTQAMDVAVANGANSASMPDEVVEVAAWLAAWLAAAPRPEE